MTSEQAVPALPPESPATPRPARLDDAPGTAGQQRGPASQYSVRRHNLALTLQHVSTAGTTSRAQLANATGLTKATVTSLVAELIDARLLIERGSQASGRTGRPGMMLSVNQQGHVGLGLEINVDYMAACVTDLAHNVRYHEVERRENRAEPASVLDHLAGLAAAALAWAGAPQSPGVGLAGVAVALPGIVDPVTRTLRNAPNLGWADLPITEMLATRLGCAPERVSVDNEANLAALGELWVGEGARWGEYIYVSAETGIGAGVITGGSVYRGAHGSAGEIGHVTLDPSGPSCGCGGRGCVERLAGQEAIVDAVGLPADTLATRAGDPHAPVRKVREALEEGQPRALQALRQAGASLGAGLANVVNVIDPDTIVLGGIYAQLLPWLEEPLSEALQRQAITARSALPTMPTVTAATLGNEAAVRGASALVIQQILDDPLGTVSSRS